MSINRLLLVLLVALLLPGLALAQTRATFAVTKVFSDENPTATATVTLNCNFGLPLIQSQTIKDINAVGVTFVLESFGTGTNCSVTEAAVPGYQLKATTGYVAAGTGSASSNATGCTWTGVLNGNANTCVITNQPAPVLVYVHKDWVIDGEGGNQIDPTYRLLLNCGTSKIDGGVPVFGTWYKVLYGNGPFGGSHANGTLDKTYSAYVTPHYSGSSSCKVEEDVYDSSVEVTGDCKASGSLRPVLGGGGDNSCTITNTVFFEGIPTLSQYGMAIMALLMLAVGFVGFRRFV